MSDPLDDIQVNEFQVLSIPLARIDLTNFKYRISREDEDIKSLALSIKETGLTQLPFVRPVGDSYAIVTGFNQVQAMLQNNDRDKVVCLTIPGVSEKKCVIIAISNITIQRPLTPVELIKGLVLLSSFMDEKIIAEKSFSIFNLQLNARYIKELYAIHSMPSMVLDLLDDNRLSIKSAKKISNYDPDLVDCLFSVFSAIKISSSKQMDIITCWMEIAAREKINPIKLYHENEIQKILLHENEDAGFKGNLLRSYLNKRRFPFLEKKQKDIREKIKELKLGKDLKLTLPENFESMSYSMTFDFKTLKEFQSRTVSLDRVSKHPALKEILER